MKTKQILGYKVRMLQSSWGRYHQEQSSQLITPQSQIFPFKNAHLRPSGLVSPVAKSSVIKLGNFCNLLSSHLRFLVPFNLLSSQRLIFRLPKNPDTPPTLYSLLMHIYVNVRHELTVDCSLLLRPCDIGCQAGSGVCEFI